MRNRKDDLAKQYKSGADEVSRHYRAGVDSVRDGYETARSRYADRTGRDQDWRRNRSDDGGSVWGVLVLAAVAGAAAVAAAPAVRRYLDEHQGHGDSEEDVSATITINRPAQELYDRWRRFEDFRDFMPDVIKVEPVGEDARESDWTVRGPAGAKLNFHSSITEDEPGRLIAWESNDNPANHSGRVTFEERGDQTEVCLELHLHPPAGVVGATIARLIGKSTGTDPRQQAERALRQFKRLMERQSGEGKSGGQKRQKGSQAGSQPGPQSGPQSDPVTAMGGASNGLGGTPAGAQPN